MSTKLKIKVGREEINKGECANPFGCAIALAVRSIFPHASVGAEDIRPFAKDVQLPIYIKLPIEAKAFIKRFDMVTHPCSPISQRDDLEEIEFEIEIPDEVLEIAGKGSLEEAKRIISESQTLELI